MVQNSSGPATNPRFLADFLTTSQAAAVGLLAVAEVARTRTAIRLAQRSAILWPPAVGLKSNTVVRHVGVILPMVVAG
ncbi:hypothetical protein GA0070616_3215 [Micromonospora nigra]|uniref:Uncharacterized protein n=1 Tax=Micromonospora nigra TaxID=145857 RepID=A0A1C6S914_9ACTN|nr:hypothetical protein [Micromonospora nigra]SCL25987.1 hypothetical protein GA0070616_3215 [Micromonospora nigra]